MGYGGTIKKDSLVIYKTKKDTRPVIT